MLTAYVHPRLGLPKFLLFEPYFLESLKQFDQGKETQIIISGGLSPSTTAARMRDSLLGYRANKVAWGTSVDSEFARLFTLHDGKFVIAGPTSNGEVWFRARHKKGGQYNGSQFHQLEGQLDKHIRTRSVVAQGASPIDTTIIRAPSCDEKVVLAFVNLKTIEGFKDTIVFPGPLPEDLTTRLASTADIAFHFDQQRNETILM